VRRNKNPLSQLRQDLKTFGQVSSEAHLIAYASLQHKTG
jgi:hypothetical protein